MNLELLRAFFLWCLILNGAFLLVAVFVCIVAGDWIYRMHSRWFPLPRDVFNAVIYGFLGLMKILVIVFNLVPWLALVIVGRGL